MKKFQLNRLLAGTITTLLLFLNTTRTWSQLILPVMRDNSVSQLNIICGTDNAYLLGLADTGGTTPSSVSGFSSSAIDTCGKFAVFYDDRNLSTKMGFDDTTHIGGTTLGLMRRETLCHVLTYLQSVFDFSRISSTDLLKLHVDTSYAAVTGYRAPSGTTFLARAAPLYAFLPNRYIAGYLNDYVRTGIDPASDFHAHVKVNFDSAVNPFVYENSDTAVFVDCTTDLYSTLLHEMEHAMGWITFVAYLPPPLDSIALHGGDAMNNIHPYSTTSTNTFSKIDSAIRVGLVFPDTLLQSLIVGTPGVSLSVNPSPLVNDNKNYWMGNLRAPDNYPVFSGADAHASGTSIMTSFVAHLDDDQAVYSTRAHTCPGDRDEYVIGPFGLQGVRRRTLTKAEIQTLVNVLGYKYIGADSTVKLHNHRPFSSKMARLDLVNQLTADTIAADFTIVNNGGPLTIRLDSFVTSGDISDGDRDTIRIDTATLVNLRGCGDGGNNHNRLSVSGGNRIITYTPRNDFYGRAQVGFSLTDNKEDGSFYVFTIDVTQGTYPLRPAIGGNMVINPGFENGTEMKITTDQSRPYTVESEQGYHEGKWQGASFSDGHPFSIWTNAWHPYGSGLAVENSLLDCGVDTAGLREGSGTVSFPSSLHPLSSPGSGVRYEPFAGYGSFSYYYLSDTLHSCHTYRIEFDAYSVSGAATNIPLLVGLKDDTSDFLRPTYRQYFIDTIHSLSSGTWTHVSYPFWFCGDHASHILLIDELDTSSFDIDNLSLKEDTTYHPPLTVSVTQSGLPGCHRELRTHVSNAACAVSYLWSGTAMTSYTAASDTVSSSTAATYTVTVSDGCRSSTDTFAVTLTPPGPISGPASVCAGSTIVLSDTVAGGVWTSSNTAIATVDVTTGILSGVSAGTVTITYTTFCSAYQTYTVTVTASPPAITGITHICSGATTTLDDATTGGTWTSSNPGIVSVGSGSGVVTGMSGGIATITYATGPACYVTATVTVNTAPSLGYINYLSTSNVCVGSTIGLIYPYGIFGGDTSTGHGTWTSQDTTIAKVLPPSSGTNVVNILGISAGTTTISYAVTNSCGTTVVTKSVNVFPTPSIISGPSSVCMGSPVTLTDTVTGGAWSSSDASVATVGALTGTVTGVSAGTVTITFTLLPSGCYVTKTITVNTAPGPISGGSVVCMSRAITLTDPVAGGLWTSSSTSIATVGSTTGVVLGVTAGVVTITYSTVCSPAQTHTVTVNLGPAAITGPSIVCQGSSALMSDPTAGGVWSAPLPSSIGSIDPTTGWFTAVSTGTSSTYVTSIIYTLSSTGCSTNKLLSINPSPSAITGASSVCAGTSTTLSDATAGGTWTSSNVAVATVGSGTGIVTGVTAGTATITYSVSIGCYVTMTVTVTTLSSIAGSPTVCVGSSDTLSDTASGGTWSSASPGIVTIGSSTGIMRGVSVGSTIVTYALSSGCRVTEVVTVNPLPASITGSTNVCVGSTVTLSDASTGGTWTSSLPGDATIGSASGIVTGVSPGITTINYTLPTGCVASTTVTVEVSPAPITGTLSVCVGTSNTLRDATTGGTWSSSATGIVTIGPSSGTMTGIATGTATITYTLPDGCYSTVPVTVYPSTAAITGSSTVCTGSTVTLSDATSGGTWSSSNTSIATVSSSGVVTGVAAGTVTITYGFSFGCFATHTMTVNIIAFSGPSAVCAGSTITLGAAPTGGIWSSSAIGVATVGAGTGVVTGISAGVVTISYVTTTGCLATKSISVNSTPAAISGRVNLCHAVPDTLHDASLDGVWQSLDTHIATIGSTGILTWVSSGIDTITYTFPATGCFVSYVVTAWDTICTPCSAFGADSFTVITSPSIASNLGRGNYYVEHSLTVATADTFSNAIIMFAPGDTLYVDTSASLVLDSSHLFSLCSEWQGMELKRGRARSGRLSVLSHSLVEDAMCAVHIPYPLTPPSGNIFTSEASIFNRNVVGVHIEHYTPNIPAYPFMIHNTVFTCRDLQTPDTAHFPFQWPPTVGVGGLKNYWSPADTFSPPFNIDKPIDAGLGYAYTSVNCYNNIPPARAIWLDSVGTVSTYTVTTGGMSIPLTYADITIGDATATTGNLNQNLFNGYQYGIYAVNTNITSINNAFTSMRPQVPGVLPDGTVTPAGGDGIFATVTDDLGNLNRLRVITPPRSSYKNLFYDFGNGVEVSNYFRIIGQNNYMITHQPTMAGSLQWGVSGYTIKTARYDTIDVSNDTISAVNNGIAVWMLRDPTYVRMLPPIVIPSEYMDYCNLSYNLIQAQPNWTDALTWQKVNMAISYQNPIVYMPPGWITSTVQSLNINRNTIHDAYDGIYVNHYSAPKAFKPYTVENQVYVRQNATGKPMRVAYGISHTHCNNSYIYDNSVQGTDTVHAPVNDSMRAFYASFNSRIDIGCNWESYIGRGYDFFMTNASTNWHGNHMQNNKVGLMLNGGLIGPQVNGGTTSSSNSMNDYWDGTWSSTNMQTYVQNAYATSSPLYVTGGSLTNPHYNFADHPLRNYIFDTSIFISIHTAPACAPVESPPPSDTGNIFDLIAKQHVDYAYEMASNTWMAQNALWRAIVLDSTIIDSSAVMAIFARMADSVSRFKYLTDIEAALTNGDVATANTLLGYNIDSMTNTAIDTLSQVNLADDTSADYIIMNYQQFYRLYIKFISETMSGSDTLALTALAQLCPEQNGGAVFQARALYSNIFNDLTVFNDDSCLDWDTTYIASRPSKNHSIQSTQDENLQHYSLYPNPNEGSFVLQQYVTDENIVRAVVYDAIGREVYRSNLQFVSARAQLNTGNNPPGLYLLELKDSKNRKFRFKFVVK